jgi:hypothetical protein
MLIFDHLNFVFFDNSFFSFCWIKFWVLGLSCLLGLSSFDKSLFSFSSYPLGRSGFSSSCLLFSYLLGSSGFSSSLLLGSSFFFLGSSDTVSNSFLLFFFGSGI